MIAQSGSCLYAQGAQRRASSGKESKLTTRRRECREGRFGMRKTLIITMAVTFFPLSGCMVGPNYKRPAAITAPSFKEATPASFAANDGWKPGQPSDTVLKGDWWTLFHDAQLNE